MWISGPDLNRDSPDGPQTGMSNSSFPASLKALREVWPATTITGGLTVVEWLILPFLLAFGRISLPSVALECITIERLIPALVVVAAKVPQLAVKSHGTFAVGWRPRLSGW